MSYMRQKYIDSVGGAAHQSACEIISELDEALNNLITEHCARDNEDYPLPPREQEDDTIKEAMILLGL